MSFGQEIADTTRNNPAYSQQIHFGCRNCPPPTTPSQPCRRPSSSRRATITARWRITTRNRVFSSVNQAQGGFVRKPDKLARVGAKVKTKCPITGQLKTPEAEQHHQQSQLPHKADVNLWKHFQGLVTSASAASQGRRPAATLSPSKY